MKNNFNHLIKVFVIFVYLNHCVVYSERYYGRTIYRPNGRSLKLREELDTKPSTNYDSPENLDEDDKDYSGVTDESTVNESKYLDLFYK